MVLESKTVDYDKYTYCINGTTFIEVINSELKINILMDVIEHMSVVEADSTLKYFIESVSGNRISSDCDCLLYGELISIIYNMFSNRYVVNIVKTDTVDESLNNYYNEYSKYIAIDKYMEGNGSNDERVYY